MRQVAKGFIEDQRIPEKTRDPVSSPGITLRRFLSRFEVLFYQSVASDTAVFDSKVFGLPPTWRRNAEREKTTEHGKKEKK